MLVASRNPRQSRVFKHLRIADMPVLALPWPSFPVAFQDYYRTTLLAEETDPNKLHDLKAKLDAAQVYSPEQIQQVVELFLGGADRDKLDPILDACVAV